MFATLPPELEAFIQAEVASGKYASTNEALSIAVRLLQEREQLIASLKSDIDEGLDAFERGDSVSICSEQDKQDLIDDISRRGRERLHAQRGNV